MSFSRTFLFIFFLAGSFLSLKAQNTNRDQEIKQPDLPADKRPFDFYERGPYQPDLPRPSAFFGYELGTFLTTYAQFEALLKEYQQRSDRLKVMSLGKTAEHRSLYLLAVSSSKNLARLEEIKKEVAEIADPRKLGAGPELDQLIRKTPLIVWLSYSIHGSESAAFEAGIQVLFQLLASQDPELREMLEQTVILINPCQNPDGHERFVTWYNAHGVGRPERYAFEHREPWSITGRLNHFFFDLNRDLISLSQIESQAATQAFLEWHPQVLADHHGQVKEYFFPPPAAPINPNLPSGISTKWLELFGRSNAAVFDKFAWSYYVRDVFDLFYPGYWDSWSSLHGATGMTYETDGGGPKGYQWSREDGTLVTLRDGIAKHFTAGINTVITAAAKREERLRDYRNFFSSTLGDLKKKYYLVPGNDVEAVESLVGLLLRHGIEVCRTNGEIKLANGKNSQGKEVLNQIIPPGSFVVDTAQPYGRMANALLEEETAQDADFVKRQEALRKENEATGTEEAKTDYEFYDVTAWSLPLAFGVNSFLSDEPVRMELTPVVSAEYPRITLREKNGDEVEKFPPVASGVAYAFEADSLASMKLAATLLEKGFRLNTSNDPVRASGRTFPRGTFFLRAERNPAELKNILQRFSDDRGVAIYSLSSAYPDQGQRGIGSEAVFALKKPKIALLAGSPTAQTSYGLMRFLLAEKCGLEVVPLAADSLQPGVLSDFNVLILPDGAAARYAKSFDEKAIAILRSWVAQGGTLICIGGASEFAADPDVKLTSSQLVGAEEKPEKDETDKKAAESPSPSPSKKELNLQKPIRVPGAIVRATVNHHSFLTIGYESATIPLLVQGNAFFKPTETGENALTFADGQLKISGFFWKDNSEQLLHGTSALMDEPIERGRVILFNTEPGFRMIWYSTIRLLLNAIIYGPSQEQADDDD